MIALAGPSVEAVIFDLDGVIVDSEIWWDEARRDYATARGRTWSEADRTAVMGANSRQWSHTMRERLSLDDPAEEIERAIVDAVVERYRREGPPRIDGAVEAVRAIAGRHPAAVASSAHRSVIAAALDGVGLGDVFHVVVSSDEVERGKPAPDVYRETARRLGVEPEACLVIEDSLNGVRAARAAGMRVVLVPNRTIPPAAGAREAADLVVDRLADLDPDRLGQPAREPAGKAAGEAAGGSEPAAARPAATRTPAAEPPAARPTPTATTRPPRSAGPRRPDAASWSRTVRYWLTRIAVGTLVRCWVRLRVEGRHHLPGGPAVYCFSHQNWLDPFFVMAALPSRPRLYFFGPKEEDMSVGARNRLMSWSGVSVPYKPGKNDLLEATRRVAAVFASGGVLAIAGEGRIHAGESELLPLSEGTGYFAIRSGVPIVPIALNGNSWVRFGGRIRVRIGEPIPTSGRPTREAIASITEETWRRLHALVAGYPDPPVPGPVARWLTEQFNEWPEGSRPEARDAPDRTG